MKNSYSYSNYLVKIMLLISLTLLVTTFSIGCSYRVYQAKIDNIEYSFQYRKNDNVNPFNPLVRTCSENIEDGVHINSHIKIKGNKLGSTDNVSKQVIQDFINSYESNTCIENFNTRNMTVGQIAGINAEGIKYYYDGYTSVQVPYEGIFIIFVYKNIIFNVDFLYPSIDEDLDEAFDVFKKTFEIRECIPRWSGR